MCSMDRMLCVAVLTAFVIPYCSGQPDKEDTTHGHPHCVCKPTMRIAMGNERGQPICNNATVNWLLNTALERISRQSEWVDEILEEMKKVEAELSESRDLHSIQGKELNEARKEVDALRSELGAKDARLAELELELNRQRKLIEENMHGKDEQRPDDTRETGIWCLSFLSLVIHSFIQAISIAPLQFHYYSEVLPTQH